MSDLVLGERDLVVRDEVAGVLEGGRDGEDSGAEHGQGDPPEPGGPVADLVLVPGPVANTLTGRILTTTSPGRWTMQAPSIGLRRG